MIRKSSRTRDERLCETVIGFSADPGDPAGIWKVEVRVKDANRNTEIPVEASFELKT
jgi:hypothetical protein